MIYKRQNKEQLPIDDGIRLGVIECRYFPKKIHVHPEMELAYINKGEGLCFAGDGIIQFRPGDLFLFGGNISHYFKSAPQFYSPNYPLKCGSTYLQFNDRILPTNYTVMPGFDSVKMLIDGCHRGMMWRKNEIDHKIITRVENLEHLQGFDRIMGLYAILNELGKVMYRARSIASTSVYDTSITSDCAYKNVIEHITHNFHRNITLDELAEHVHMNRSALCRHFRTYAGRSIFDFILDFRIHFAQLQLISTHLPISEIANEAGFNNIPNFNVQFKRISGCTPGDYRLHGIETTPATL